MEAKFLVRDPRNLSATFCLVLAMACGGGGGSSDNDTGTGTTPDSNGQQGDTLLANCPVSSTLIQTTEWTSCLEGKTLSGSEPFTSQSCELRIKASGAFDYVRDNAIAISVPERSVWQAPTGTYQNDGTGESRIFIASIAPDLPAVAGQPRVTNVNISISGLSSQQDKVEIKYFDSALARQTYNCNVTVL